MNTHTGARTGTASLHETANFHHYMRLPTASLYEIADCVAHYSTLLQAQQMAAQHDEMMRMLAKLQNAKDGVADGQQTARIMFA